MTRPKFYVDFNELLTRNLVCLSQEDTKIASSGERIALSEGMEIDVYSDDIDDRGQPDNLVASGVVERNSVGGWTAHIKWNCRIDENGIRHESDLVGK